MLSPKAEAAWRCRSPAPRTSFPPVSQRRLGGSGRGGSSRAGRKLQCLGPRQRDAGPARTCRPPAGPQPPPGRATRYASAGLPRPSPREGALGCGTRGGGRRRSEPDDQPVQPGGAGAARLPGAAAGLRRRVGARERGGEGRAARHRQGEPSPRPRAHSPDWPPRRPGRGSRLQARRGPPRAPARAPPVPAVALRRPEAALSSATAGSPSPPPGFRGSRPRPQPGGRQTPTWRPPLRPPPGAGMPPHSPPDPGRARAAAAAAAARARAVGAPSPARPRLRPRPTWRPRRSPAPVPGGLAAPGGQEAEAVAPHSAPIAQMGKLRPRGGRAPRQAGQ